MNIAVNGRFQGQPQSGVQRYASEIAQRLAGSLRVVPAPAFSEGALAVLWEQTALAVQTRGELLWSPANTGPLIKREQVVTIHDLATFDHPEWFAPRFAAYYQWLLPRLVSRARAVICVSEFTRSRLVARWPGSAARTAVANPGVSSRFTRSTDAQATATLARLGLEPDGYLLCLASREPRKNHARLIEAWGTLAPRFEVPLVLAGQSGRGHIFKPAHADGEGRRVRQLGPVADSDLPALYSGARAFVFPSLYEGFGIPPLEAAACGTPVVAADLPPVRECLRGGARYCDPGDTASIAGAISDVMASRSLREELSGLAQERVRLYSWERAAAETWRVLSGAAC